MGFRFRFRFKVRKWKFVYRMHGAGNDFVFIDCLKHPADLAAVASLQPRFGVSADQLLTVHPSKVADFKMEIYNADGSQVEMCGNGIRCFAKYVYDHGITRKRELEVETLAGIIRPRIVGELVEVDMGEPILEGRKIPVDADGEIRNRPLAVDGITYEVTCVSMGNPHCVLYLDDIDALDLEKIGPRFEHHPFFPKRVNTEFIKILSPAEVKMRVWGVARARPGPAARAPARWASPAPSPVGRSGKSRCISKAATC
jgi:diaminopimelate epimerase